MDMKLATPEPAPLVTACLVILLLAPPTAAVAQESAPNAPEASADDILNMDLEQLSRADVVVSNEMSTEVTSVSRTEQPISRTASAVFVITNEMIRRSGARNIPEALRMAPGVHVARINSHTWAISIHGSNSDLANKLLVQIDGRPIYTMMFGGTFWEHQFVPLKDVERIEVVRGPGGAAWGANAVNGVISVVTKSAHDTTGGYLRAGGGSEHRGFTHARLGGYSGELSYRFYGTYTDDDQGFLPTGALDGRRAAMGGFRMDWAPNCSDVFTFQGEVFDGQNGLPSPVSEFQGCHLLSRYTRQVDDDTDWSIQTFYDEYNRLVGRDVTQSMFDLDATCHTRVGCRHDVVCGFGFRDYNTDINEQLGANNFIPDDDQFDIISYFVSDTWTLIAETAFLTIGSKMEHSDFVGFTYQPSVKLAITPDERTSLWASVGRSVRTPARNERDINLNLGSFTLLGSPRLTAEQALTYELGLRRQPNDYLYWDANVFYTRYEDLVTYTFLGSATWQNANASSGEAYGGEVWGTLNMTETWSIRAFYAYLRDDFTNPPFAFAFTTNPNSSPRNMAYLTSSHDVSINLTFDATLRYADRVRSGVGDYLVADLRLGYQPRENLEYSVVGQNLFDQRHREFAGIGSTEVESGVYAMIEWGY